MNWTQTHAIALALAFTAALDAGPKPTVIDMESFPQDFIVETKQIILPEFPGAFNPSIVRWNGNIFMTFRTRTADMVSDFKIGCVWLNESFEPISVPQILQFRNENPDCLDQRQDPRLIVINDELYIIFSNFIKIENLVTRRMFIGKMQYADGAFFVESPVCVHPFENWTARWEKNWVPFEYDNALRLAYSIVPHKIFTPSLESGACTTLSSSLTPVQWKFGELRGGTPALKVGNEYLAFFHSSKDFYSTLSDNKKISHYLMGAYTFSAEPPFELKRISPQPIVHETFYHGPMYNTWKPLRVVFAMGYIIDGNDIWVSYGRQDFEMWVARIDAQKLFDSLVPCTTA